MNLSKRLLVLLLIPIFLSTHLHAIAPTELDHQMKDFRHRVRVYFKCFPGMNYCTKEEWQAAGKTILKDGAKLLMGLFVVGAGLFIGVKYIYPELVYQHYVHALNKAIAAEKKLNTIDPKLKKYDAAFQEYTQAKEYADSLFKKVFPSENEKLKAKYEKLYDQWKEAEFAVDYTLPQDSSEFKSAAQKAKKLEEQVKQLQPKLRGSFFYQD